MMIVLLILGFMNDMDVKSEAGVNHSKIIEMNQAASLRLRLIRISNYHESAPLVYRWIMFRGVGCRVATKIFEDYGGALNKVFIIGREPVSIVHYTRPRTCINRPLH